jgi:HNH endonuclease/AP2 domain
MENSYVICLRVSGSSIPTKIDFDDYSKVKPHLKTLNLRKDGYVYLNEISNTKLHRLVMGAKPGELVDHINRMRLDNRRSNLRIATPSQNAMNRSPRGKYKGVSYRKDKKKYHVQAKDPETNKTCHLGFFNNDIEAARAYDEFIKGVREEEYCYLNNV